MTLSVVAFIVVQVGVTVFKYATFRVEILALTKFMARDAITLVVERALDTHKFPVTFTLAPERPIEFWIKIEKTFVVPITFRVVT